MYNISAKIVQKASATVQSTVNTVASVASSVGSGRKHYSDDRDSETALENYREKVTLHIKVC